ncbi:MAG: hypothetical protein ACI9TV_000059 [Sulfurimonas sp.]|jgi:uncharacterized protein|uniref:PP0621 family protein n=1 Tax=Sulfurimonas sp. TaxID=2022749 RepID=UPI0039E2A881
MILKVLLVLAVIGIVYFIFIKKKPLRKPADIKEKKKEKLESNDMVECASCGTYTELSETIISSNKYYCSNECVDKA